MKNQRHLPAIAPLTLAALLFATIPAWAQVAGSTTTLEASVTASTQLAHGWSVKKTLMGKTIYSDANKKVGIVDDLIISTDGNVSYVIVGAGGFVGIGRHDVAIPVALIEERDGKIVMLTATRASIMAMPAFTYTTDKNRRDHFVAAADKDIASGKAKMAELEKKAGVATTEAKTRLDLQIVALKGDLKSADNKLTEMKHASAARWKEFEADVNTAMTKLRKSIDTATG